MTEAQVELQRLLDIMAALRDPETGCPWDRQQDFATIAPYTIEEACEVADAIARRDWPALPGELGDLLFQVVYHARLAEERGLFRFSDVAGAIADKMLRRHPHVFGDEAARGAGPAPGAWEAAKAAERRRQAAGPQQAAADETSSQKDQRPFLEGSNAVASAQDVGTVLADIPIALPALSRAAKITRRVAAVGFDWPDAPAVLDKLAEETGELRAELAQADPARLSDELGDMLFVMANLARKLGLDAETCLRQANAKFTRRFNGVERLLAANGNTPADATLAAMEAAWQQVKRHEAGPAPDPA
jgi:ATP diphosphatase